MPSPQHQVVRKKDQTIKSYLPFIVGFTCGTNFKKIIEKIIAHSIVSWLLKISPLMQSKICWATQRLHR